MSYADHLRKVKNNISSTKNSVRFFEPSLGTQAGKLAKEGIPYFNLPAGFTCPGAGRCKDAKFCYAMTGNTERFPAVLRSQSKNYLSSLQSYFVDIMIDKIKRIKSPLDLFRVHESGDFYSQEYIEKWAEIARNIPEIKFYAYTKSYVNLDLSTLWALENFNLIQSTGSRDDTKIDYSLPHATIFRTKEQLLSAGYADCSEKDSISARSTKVGLVLHGTNARKF